MRLEIREMPEFKDKKSGRFRGETACVGQNLRGGGKNLFTSTGFGSPPSVAVQTHQQCWSSRAHLRDG